MDSYEFNEISLQTPPGKISFYPPAPKKMKVFVKYYYLPLDLPTINFINKPPRTYSGEVNKEDKESAQELNTQKANVQEVNYDFLQSGTFTRGINLQSNSGMSIESGLDLNLEGELTDNIVLKGVLTDKNVPIQPEGNTQRLNELDRVYMTIEMPKEDLTFGDFNIDINKGKYGQYSRKLQGLKARSQRDKYSGILSGAVSKGEFHTNKFSGEEGKQGPYQLKGENGEEAIIVLAGTEDVYINGQELTRGENNDYVIDYSTAEITFTSDQLITSNSRITVDFQYSDLVYQRNIVSNSNTFSFFNDKLDISAGYINESDDKNNPIEMDIDSSDKKRLKNIGDTTGRVLKSTIKKDSTGNYYLRDSILVFAGEGKGTHSASFSNVGQEGKYRKHYEANQVYFEYVDKSDPAVSQEKKDEAVYLPVRPLQLPRSHQLYHFRSKWNPNENILLDVELAGSDQDENTFSDLDNSEKRGGAVKIDAKYQTEKSRYGQVGLDANYIQEGKSFQPIYRSNIIEYNRKWDIEPGKLEDKKLYQTGLDYKYQNNLNIDLGGGKLNYSNYSTHRIDGGVDFNYKNLKQLYYSVENINTSVANSNIKKWRRQDLNAKYNIMNLQPFYRYDGEYRTNDSLKNDNFKFDEHTIGIQSLIENSQFEWGINYRERKNHEKDSTNANWYKESFARDLTLRGKVIDWKDFTTSVKWTGRRKKYFNSQRANVEYYLLKGNIRHNPGKLPFRWQKNVKVDEKYTVKKEEIYYEVDKGRGKYRYDSTYAEYVPHPRGKYIRRIITTNIRRPITQFQTGLRFRFDGNQIDSEKETFIKNISTQTRMRLDQKIKNDHNLANIYRFSISGVDSNWTNYYRSIRQDINYDLNAVDGRIKISYNDEDRIGEEDVRGKEKNSTERYTLNYRGNFIYGVKLQSEYEYHHRKRNSWISSSRTHNIKGYNIENEFSYRLENRDQFKLKFTYNKDRESEDRMLKSNLILTRLEYEKSILDKGKGRIFFEFDNVTVKPEDMPLPWQMSEGKRPGETFGVGVFLEYNVSKHINISLNYEGWKEPEIPIYHSGDIKVRAYF